LVAIFTAIHRDSFSFDPNQSSDLPTVFQIGTARAKRMRHYPMTTWYDSLSSKDLLEACVAFAIGLTFVMAFRWKK
jgi:hypothetical protein